MIPLNLVQYNVLLCFVLDPRKIQSLFDFKYMHAHIHIHKTCPYTPICEGNGT